MHVDGPMGPDTVIAHIQLEASGQSSSIVRCLGSLRMSGVARFGAFFVERVIDKVAGDFCAALTQQLRHYARARMPHVESSNAKGSP